MANSKHEQLVIYIDTRVIQILSTNGGPIELFVILEEIGSELNWLMKHATKNEIDTYYEQYEGFHAFITFFIELSSVISRKMNFEHTYH